MMTPLRSGAVARGSCPVRKEEEELATAASGEDAVASALHIIFAGFFPGRIHTHRRPAHREHCMSRAVDLCTGAVKLFVCGPTSTRYPAHSPWRPETRRWSREAAALSTLVVSAATMAEGEGGGVVGEEVGVCDIRTACTHDISFSALPALSLPVPPCALPQSLAQRLNTKTPPHSLRQNLITFGQVAPT